MSPNGSVRRYRLPCLRTWTLPRSVAFWIGIASGSTNATAAGSVATTVERAGPFVGVRCAFLGTSSAGGVDLGAGREGASGRFVIVISGDRGQAIGLVGHDERIDQPIDVAVHHPRQGRHVEADPA